MQYHELRIIAELRKQGRYAEAEELRFSGAVTRCMKADDKFPRVTVHDLRHTAASLAISAGANVKVVQRMLGHASAAMTLDVYSDLFADDLDAVADAHDAKCVQNVSTGGLQRPV
jgi:integrase